MKKKILSFILAVLMVVSCFGTFAVSAAEYTTPTIAVECSEIGSDNTFTADIVIYNNPGISGYEYTLKFDNSMIQIVDVVRDEDDVPVSAFPAEATLNIDEGTASPSSYNELVANAARAKASTKNGVYLSVIFKVVGEFEEAFITIEDEMFVNSDYNAVGFDTVDGSVGLPKIEGVTFEGATFVYDGTEKSIAVKGATSAMTVEYSPKTAKNVGTNKITAIVKQAGYATLTLTANIVITPKTLTIDGVKVTDKTFDNTTTAKVDYTNAKLVGVVAGDDVTFTKPAATFADANVGTGKTMTMDAITLGGAAAGNYTLTQPTLKGVIIQRTVTIVPDAGQGKKIGTADPALTYTVDGDLCGYTLVGALSRAAGETVNTYKINIGTLKTNPDNGNIKLVLADEVFAILDKTVQDVTVTAPSYLIPGSTGNKISVAVNKGTTAVPTFSTSDAEVVTVDASGNLTTVGVGKATITVTVAGDDEYATFTKLVEIEVVALIGTISTVDCLIGNTVKVPVYITNNPGIAGYQIEFTYDHTKLHLVEVENGSILSAEPTFNFDEPGFVENGTIVLFASQDSNSTAVGELVVITFEVLEGTPEGSYEIGYNASYSLAANQDRKELPVIFTVGAVNAIDMYSIAYNADGGEGSPAKQKKVPGENITLSSVVPTKTGYNFVNWLGSDGKTYNPGDVYAVDADLTLTAVWEIKTYTIVYNANGGTNAPANATKEHFAEYTVSDVIPTKEGYDFSGWLGSDGKIYNAGDVYAGNTDITFTAVWVIKTYTIIYNANGGVNAPANATKEHAARYTISDVVPTKEGYNFRGWAGSDGKTYNAGDVYEGNADLTLTAVWTLKKYNVFYNANGGANAPANATKEHFAKYTVSSVVPTKEGYDFQWWTGSDGKIYNAGDIYEGNADLTLTAIWTIKVYDVVYNANGGVNAPANATKEHFADYVVSDDVPTKEGYNFRGWAGSDSKTYNAGDVYEGNADLTLTAVWTLKKYNVFYNANGGANAPANATKEHFAKYTVSDVVPTRNGYNFMGWATSADGEVAYAPGATYSENADITFYAVWSPVDVVVTYDACGGEVSPATKTVKFDGVYGELAAPTRAGYTFDGWYSAKDGGKKISADTVVDSYEGITIYARWEANSYTVTYDATGAVMAGDRTKTVVFDSAYGALPVPAIAGFVFDGWYTATVGGELVTSETIVTTASDHTLYAHFSPATYSIFFDANGGECADDYKTVIFNTVFGDLPIPTRKGYTFVTWSKTKTESGAVNASTPYQTTSDTTLYAIWKVNTYTVTFDALGGSADLENKVVTFDSAYGDFPTATKANYIFGGWFFETTYENKLTSDTIVSVADNHTVYAMWIPATFSIVYDANGGEGAPDGQTKDLDVDLVLSDVVPTRKGYKFCGWATTADGEVAYASGATYSKNENLVLYAVWEKVMYADANGDGAINAKDAVLLAQYLAGWDVKIDLVAADCNGDGAINAKDTVLLAQHLAGWDVTLG